MITNGQGHEGRSRPYKLDPQAARGVRPNHALLGWDHLHGGWRRLVGLDIPAHGKPAWPVMLQEHRCPDRAAPEAAWDRPGAIPEMARFPEASSEEEAWAAIATLWVRSPPVSCRMCWAPLKSGTVVERDRGTCRRCFNAGIGAPAYDPGSGRRVVWFCQASKAHRLRRTVIQLGNGTWACPECFRRIRKAEK